MPLRTLIVDDEPIARRVLREELDCLNDVEIIGEAENGATALAKSPNSIRILCSWIFRCRRWAAWK